MKIGEAAVKQDGDDSLQSRSNPLTSPDRGRCGTAASIPPQRAIPFKQGTDTVSFLAPAAPSNGLHLHHLQFLLEILLGVPEQDLSGVVL